jgi:hypothetical protein
MTIALGLFADSDSALSHSDFATSSDPLKTATVVSNHPE